MLIALQFLGSPLHPSLQTPATSDLLTVSKVLPFPECHMTGITQYGDYRTSAFHVLICM